MNTIPTLHYDVEAQRSNFPFGLGFLLATFFFVFGTLFGRKKVALLNPFRAAKPPGKLPAQRADPAVS